MPPFTYSGYLTTVTIVSFYFLSSVSSYHHPGFALLWKGLTAQRGRRFSLCTLGQNLVTQTKPACDPLAENFSRPLVFPGRRRVEGVTISPGARAPTLPSYQPCPPPHLPGLRGGVPTSESLYASPTHPAAARFLSRLPSPSWRYQGARVVRGDPSRRWAWTLPPLVAPWSSTRA